MKEYEGASGSMNERIRGASGNMSERIRGASGSGSARKMHKEYKSKKQHE
jgi:hypothetical protein